MFEVAQGARGRAGLGVGCLWPADGQFGGPGPWGRLSRSPRVWLRFHFPICRLRPLWPYGNVNSCAGSFSSQEGCERPVVANHTGEVGTDAWGGGDGGRGPRLGERHVGVPTGVQWAGRKGRGAPVGAETSTVVWLVRLAAELRLRTQAHEPSVQCPLHYTWMRLPSPGPGPGKDGTGLAAKGVERSVSHAHPGKPVQPGSSQPLGACHTLGPVSHVPCPGP